MAVNKNLIKAAVIAFGVAILGWALVTYVNGASSYMPEGMASKQDLPPLAGGPSAADAVHANPKSLGGNLSVPAGADGAKPSELLPAKGLGSEWSSSNPVGLGSLQGQNFLSTGHNMGVQTVTGHKKFMSHDLRATIPNPKLAVTVFNNSSIEADPHPIGLQTC